MVRQTITALGILVVITAFAFPVNAQDYQAEPPIPGTTGDPVQETIEGQVEPQQFSGTVIREKTVDVKGLDIEHQIVMLEIDEGERIIADLGPADILEEQGLEFEDGQQLDLRGTVARVSDRPVILASEVSAADKTIRIDRPELAGQVAEPGERVLPKNMEVTGEIITEKSVEVEDLETRNKVVLLELENGENVVADLGREEALDMELDAGEKVTIQGNLARIGDQLVLLADQVTNDDKSTAINRIIQE